MKKKMDRGERQRCEGIIARAHELSKALIASEPSSCEIAIGNFKMIYQICADLVSLDRPARRPDYDVVATYGARIRADFIAKQTIKNRYRKMTRVWCDAFDKIVDGQPLQAWTDFSRTPIMDRGSGLSADIHKEVVRRLWIENTRLRADQKQRTDSEFAERVPDNTSDDTRDQEPINVDAIREWVTSVGHPQSLLSSTEVGLKLNENVRYGMIVMDFETFAAIRAVAGVRT
ncbi:hypothetical protein GR217_22825 [Rhizobium leguminosarum]|uniref:Uncharacterized protein n=1 Tax=Rhizobium ruizarguesonis TaxID=2081791 RepID=A0AAE4YSQ5_9HYPH|nr:hypothetical protein [Rhizobium ruizarguesonis]NEI50522.1 hypothetical protein [Rhizobium ruizarguesonis]